MTTDPMRIAYLTAGAAGMYCGSCLHDNTLAAALTRLGVDIQLIPTPNRVRHHHQHAVACKQDPRLHAGRAAAVGIGDTHFGQLSVVSC